ncbi:MAG: hypothetical protein JNK54_10810 [Elusimicrobia bacterium]|nr:hypothetical protein [Elusimicrobiota bacterium]
MAAGFRRRGEAGSRIVAGGRSYAKETIVFRGLFLGFRIRSAGQKRSGIDVEKVENAGLVLWQFGVI